MDSRCVRGSVALHHEFRFLVAQYLLSGHPVPIGISSQQRFITFSSYCRETKPRHRIRNKHRSRLPRTHQTLQVRVSGGVSLSLSIIQEFSVSIFREFVILCIDRFNALGPYSNPGQRLFLPPGLDPLIQGEDERLPRESDRRGLSSLPGHR
jgi:hypothetical protein